MAKNKFTLKGHTLPGIKQAKKSGAPHIRTFGENTSWEEVDAVTAHNKAHKEEKKNLTLYSFRHSYSLRAHQRGIDPESVALAMRHDLKTHTSFYPWAEKKKVKEVFKKLG